MKWRAVYLILMGLVLAGLVHIAIVLLIPKYGTKDAWAFLSGRTDLFSFTRLKPEETGSAISEVDPFFTYGVCRFDLDEAPLKMVGPLTSTFWSASAFDDDGTVIYSLNNRTAIDNKLDLLIVNPLQTLELRENEPETVETSVVIEAAISKGFVIIRVLQPDESWTTDSDAFFSQIECQRYTF
ncbi:MAG: DUF1254 domain-containing protein [Salaquimonas sp.]